MLEPAGRDQRNHPRLSDRIDVVGAEVPGIGQRCVEPGEHVGQGGAVGAGVPQHLGQDHLAVLIDEVLRVVAVVERPVGGLHEPGDRVGGSATG